jgi:hypothetical protein
LRAGILICVNARRANLRDASSQYQETSNPTMRSDPMTQHLSPEDTAADRRAMRQLFTVIGSFAIATAIMAVIVGMIMG